MWSYPEGQPQLRASPPGQPLVLMRVVGVLGLLGLALIHLLDLPDTADRSLVDGLAYIGLILASMGIAGVMLIIDRREIWFVVALIAMTTFAAYALSRTTGIPGDHVDIGDWRDPLGIASNFVEGTLVLLAAAVLIATRHPGRRSALRLESSGRAAAPSSSDDSPHPELLSTSRRG